MSVESGSGKVFGWFVNMTSVAGLMTWFGISVTYLRFHAGLVAQGYDRSKLPYASKLNPFAAWYAAIACIVVCFVRLLILSLPHVLTDNITISSPAGLFSSRTTGILPPLLRTILCVDRVLFRLLVELTFHTKPFMLFPALYIGSAIWYRCKPIKAVDMDFVTDIKEIEAATYEDPPPRNWVERFWGWLVSEMELVRHTVS